MDVDKPDADKSLRRLHRMCIFLSECVNAESDTRCNYWAGIGECQRNPEYMLRYCQWSCRDCPEYGTGTCIVSSWDANL